MISDKNTTLTALNFACRTIRTVCNHVPCHCSFLCEIDLFSAEPVTSNLSQNY